MLVKDLIKLLPYTCEELEKYSGLKENSLKNRRYRRVDELKVKDALKITNFLNVDIYKLVKITTDDIEKMKKDKHLFTSILSYHQS